MLSLNSRSCIFSSLLFAAASNYRIEIRILSFSLCCYYYSCTIIIIIITVSYTYVQLELAYYHHCKQGVRTTPKNYVQPRTNMY